MLLFDLIPENSIRSVVTERTVDLKQSDYSIACYLPYCSWSHQNPRRTWFVNKSTCSYYFFSSWVIYYSKCASTSRGAQFILTTFQCFFYTCQFFGNEVIKSTFNFFQMCNCNWCQIASIYLLDASRSVPSPCMSYIQNKGVSAEASIHRTATHERWISYNSCQKAIFPWQILIIRWYFTLYRNCMTFIFYELSFRRCTIASYYI